jgi:hypothetical protein
MGATKELFTQIREDLTKTEEECFNGELSNLDALIKMRKVKDECEIILQRIKDFENDRINEIGYEAEQYGGKYCGYEIKSINGRKIFNFKGIEEIEQKEIEVKNIKKQYEIAFDGILKGVVQTTESEGIKYWVDNNGDLKTIPELTIGKSYLTIKEIKQK